MLLTERFITFVMNKNILIMRILVTGANGLLGHQVVMELIKRKYKVNIIVRQKSNIFFDLTAVNIVTGNFTDYNDLLQAAKGCDAIIHIAAVTATNLLKYSDYHKINVEGTQLILKVAEELNINRIVYISSSNTVGFGTALEFGNESFPVKYPFTNSYYAQSKVESEKIIIKASETGNRHFIIVNPSFMIGAYDTKPSSGKLMLMGYKRRWMATPKGGKNFVSAHGVAVAVCNALTEGKNGERYLASGINLSFREFYKIQSGVGGYTQKIIEIPDLFLSIMGKIGDLLRKTGVKTEICTMNLSQLQIKEYYDNEKAKSALKLPDTDLEKEIKEALDWFKMRKMI